MITHGNVLSFVQLSPLIDSGDVQEIGSESNWITTITSYLKDGVLPDEKEAARKLKVRAARFIFIKDVLYKIGFSRPYLRVKIASTQACASRILLAYHAGRR